MKRIFTRFVAVAFVLLFWGTTTTAWAQRSKVEEAEQVVNGISQKGQRILIQLDSKVVEKAWKAYLKNEAGSAAKGASSKDKAPKGIYIVEEGFIDSISSNPLRIVSKVQGAGDSTVLWWSLSMGNKYLSQEETAEEWTRSALFLQQFARSLYLDEVELQVEDAELVLMNSQAEAKRVARRAQDIQIKIAKKKEHRAKLETALAANAKELETMTKKLQKSLLQEEAAKQEAEIMRRSVEEAKAQVDKL